MTELSDLPAITALVQAVDDRFELPMAVITSACRQSVEDARAAIRAGRDADPEEIAVELLNHIAASRPRSVINATGVLLHTNLGRAPLVGKISQRSARIHRSASNVEIDIRTGRRSRRHDYLGTLLPLVTGAEAGFAVNNNAGALLLSLASVAGSGGSVAVSRGELIEIGGSFRLPDLMAASGARLVEVGTTNRTRAADYAAVADRVDAMLKVHPSNYRIDGFQQEATYGELAGIATAAGIPLVADVGSGLVDETAPWLGEGDRAWLADEPGVIQTVSAGADLVLFSGDKLLGGPQCGIIVGKQEAVRAAMKHPIARAVRLDGGSIAAVADTFELYADQRVLEIPFWRMAAADVSTIDARCRAVVDGLETRFSVVSVESVPGAGSVPGTSIASRAIEIHGDADAVWASLAAAPIPIISTRRKGSVFIDMRSVLPEDDAAVREAVTALVA